MLHVILIRMTKEVCTVDLQHRLLLLQANSVADCILLKKFAKYSMENHCLLLYITVHCSVYLGILTTFCSGRHEAVLQVRGHTFSVPPSHLLQCNHAWSSILQVGLRSRLDRCSPQP